jgi:CRP/FNR family transcriptional regulator, cyclic AMP receptor protein
VRKLESLRVVSLVVPVLSYRATHSKKRRMRGATQTRDDRNGFQVMNLDGKFLAEFGKGKTIKHFDRNTVVFAQGDAANALFYIRNGKVKVTVLSNVGKEAVIAVLGAGDFVGEGCLAGQQLRISTATAMTECSILRLEKATVVEMLKEEPAFSELLLSYILMHSIRIEEDLIDHLFNSSEKRLARALLLLANSGEGIQPETVIPKISQKMLADMIGTTRSRVSFFMNKFRRLGFIEYNGTIKVRSSLLSVVLHDQD